MKNRPISMKAGAIFIPVKDIEKARNWYCNILGIPADGEIMFGHLYILPVKDPGIVLDSGIYSEENTYRVAPFHFNTDDIHEAYEFMKEKGVSLLTEIQHDHFFNFKDPDGNQLMVCQC